jgi:hypothetical protein
MIRRIQLALLTVGCLGLAAFTVQPARAQSQPTDQTQPGVQPGMQVAVQNLDDTQPTDVDGNTLAPDTRALAGVRSVSLGVPALEHSYWLPSFNATVAGDSDPLFAPGVTSWTTWTTLLGSLKVRANSTRSEFTLDYVGGGSISNDASVQNAVVQEMQIGERLLWRRASLSLLDQGAYIPETSFGYGGLDTLSLPGGGGLGLQPSLFPTETILSARGQRLSNSSLVELDALLSKRMTFTLAGGYAFLHYFNDDLLNFANTIGQAGLSYDMSRHDTVAVIYRFDSYRFPNANDTLVGHIGELSYARRVTGKLAFQLGGGAEFAIFRVPAYANSPNWPSHTYWVADGTLSYQLRRTVLGLTYSHGISGGSGVLSGTLADTVTGSISSQLSRTFHGDFSAGFARNEPISILASSTTTPNPSFDYTYGTVGFTHPWGRSMTWSLGYLVQYQKADQTYCVGTACGTTILRQQVSLGFNLHTRPFPID